MYTPVFLHSSFIVHSYAPALLLHSFFPVIFPVDNISKASRETTLLEFPVSKYLVTAHKAHRGFTETAWEAGAAEESRDSSSTGIGNPARKEREITVLEYTGECRKIQEPSETHKTQPASQPAQPREMQNGQQ